MAQAKWVSLAEFIRSRIASGEWAVGDRLPSQAELRRRFGVSDTVIRNALITLKAERLVQGVPGVGMFVADRSDRGVDGGAT